MEKFNQLKERLLTDEEFVKGILSKLAKGPNEQAKSDEGVEELFAKAIKSVLGQKVEFTEQEAPFVKAITPQGGEFLVPTGFIPKIIDAVKSVGLVRNLANVIPVAQPAGYLPKIGNHPSVAWSGESLSQNTSFEAISWTLKEVRSVVYVSSIIADYSPKNIANILAKEMAKAIARDEDMTFLTNDPSQNPNRPAGIVSQVPNVNVVDNSNNKLTYDAVVEAISVLTAHEPTFAQNSVFLVSPKGLQALASVKDGQGRPIFDTLLRTADQKDCCYAGMALGRPVYVTTALSVLDGEDSNGNETTQILVGDMSQAFVFLGNTMTVSMSKDERFSDNLITVKAVERKDFVVAYPEAFALIKTQV